MIEKIIQAIDEQISNLEHARKLLSQGSRISLSKPPISTGRSQSRRKLSAKARRAIAEGQRKRWAKIKSGTAAAPPVLKKKEDVA